MARAIAKRFDDLPLFASDADLAIAIVGTDPEKRATWIAQLPILEARGFPRPTSAYGRYRPAVKDFYDRFYAINAKEAAPTDSREEGEWNSKRSSRRRA